jgi:hypothetical protein
MRSKSVAERSTCEDKAAACVANGGALHMSGTLSLVRGTEPRSAGKKKPGLY